MRGRAGSRRTATASGSNSPTRNSVVGFAAACRATPVRPDRQAAESSDLQANHSRYQRLRIGQIPGRGPESALRKFRNPMISQPRPFCRWHNRPSRASVVFFFTANGEWSGSHRNSQEGSAIRKFRTASYPHNPYGNVTRGLAYPGILICYATLVWTSFRQAWQHVRFAHSPWDFQ